MQKTEFKPEPVRPVVNGWVRMDTVPIAGVQAQRWTKEGCGALISHEPHGGSMRWHASLSRKDSLPSWGDIKDFRYSLLPLDLTFAQILPPPEDYVNLHQYCLHLWEIEGDEW